MRNGLLILSFVALLCAPAWAQSRRGRTRSPQTGISDLETPVATFQGKVRSISKKEIVLDMPEDQSIAFHISHKTKFVKDDKPIKAAAISAGATVMVEGKRDALGNTDAVSVTLDPKPPKPAPAPNPTAPPPPANPS
jgi:hypothetical protein